MTSFKYLGSLFTSEGGSQADVNNMIRIGWMKWKEVSGVMCDWKMPVELKDRVFKTIIRPAMTYGSECWAVMQKGENKLNSAEMRMLRCARGKTMLDHIRNEDIRTEAHVKPVEAFREFCLVVWTLLEPRTQPHLSEITKGAFTRHNIRLNMLCNLLSQLLSQVLCNNSPHVTRRKRYANLLHSTRNKIEQILNC